LIRERSWLIVTDVKSREQHPGDKEEIMNKDLYKECPSFTFDIAQS
jgi:hypothetical protein